MSRSHNTRRNDSPELDSMVAVAAGKSARVSHWLRVLKSAGIRAQVIQACACDDSGDDYAELWVEDAAADDARDVLRTSDSATPFTIW